jgi:anti-sigma factor RsiW
MCLDDKTLSAYIDGELGEPWKTQVDEHLLHCGSCKRRYDQLVVLERDIQSARLQDYEFEDQKTRVWDYLKKHVVSEEPRRFFKRRFYVSAPMLMGAAAALVLLFAVNFFVVRTIAVNPAEDTSSIPVISSAPQTESAQGEMIQVSASDSVAVARALENLSVEQILQLLDQKGFEVDLRLKDVEKMPAGFELEDATVQTPPAEDETGDEEQVPSEDEQPAEQEDPAADETEPITE